MEIVLIGDKDTVTGFRLAGLKKAYSIEDEHADLKSILSDETTGVLILTERFAEDNRKLIESHRESKKMTPIVVEIPDMAGPVQRDVDPIRELIKRAIGADVK